MFVISLRSWRSKARNVFAWDNAVKSCGNLQSDSSGFTSLATNRSIVAVDFQVIDARMRRGTNVTFLGHDTSDGIFYSKDFIVV